ncbi:FtsX-like permease family protein [uncultured Hyphomonas sp.]|jgi:putative ABC transport system permease protein|uniref:ABC transporter permease n=1 Tax=uncultured Hyphomonas sp. TaxID=225298 RepID=UPI000C35E20D|nr:peptide ABC transporter permease [Hyphomonadaceae bacterium]MBL4878443.1 ABC transporter permease [Hyphomonas sp.]HBL94189.1 peptide ABC transporter permease [Hyphomonas sp.]|tara:strand:+ start:6806 stop:8074 length:1269 start_codon:yes stop_codon:yes gene_type:complete
MSAILALAWKSLMNRKGSVLLTLLAVALSVALFLGVDKARTGAREGFGNTISGTELIVGAPTGSVNLLLYSVFRMGSATAEISWPTYKEIAARPDVDWAVPISLGDSHRGFRVMGTTPDYFDHYKYGRNQDLLLAEGEQFEDLFDAVIGADVARELDYTLGSPMVLSHGLGQADFGSGHENRPFRVVGILAPTGTPVDQTVHVSLEAITAIHVGWETGAKNPLADNITEETIRSFDLTPKTVTAIFLGLKRRGTILTTRREINTNRGEPLMAIIPSQALAELWSVTAIAERALLAVSIFVIAVGVVSILTSILTSLNERRREMSILRAVGARPGHIFALLVLEAGLVGFLGAALGILLIHVLLAVVGPLISAHYGISLIGTGPGLTDLYTLLAVTGAALLAGAIPAWMAFRRSLADGLSIRL